jgi:hypothetical protein
LLDDTAVMTIREAIESSTREVQSAVNRVETWTKEKWLIKLNESKSVYIDSTNKKIRQKPVFTNVHKFRMPTQQNILV